MSTDSPLRPGYVKEVGYVVKDCPSEWDECSSQPQGPAGHVRRKMELVVS
jgi:hypothetical protein